MHQLSKRVHKISIMHIALLDFYLKNDHINTPTAIKIKHLYCTKKGDVKLCHVYIRELKQRRFWATQVNWKWGLTPFYMPWLSKICIAEFLFSYKHDLPETFNQTSNRRCKMSTSGWRPSLKNAVAQAPYYHVFTTRKVDIKLRHKYIITCSSKEQLL